MGLLKGERIGLRSIESEEDIRYLFKAFNDPEAMGEYVSFEARSWEAFQTFIKEGAKSTAQFTPFLIEKRDGDNRKIIGSLVHFIPHPLVKSCLEIGYGIDDITLRRKGYALEAVGLLIDYLFETKILERIQATTNIANIGSQRVLEKLGFTKEGTMRKGDFIKGKFSDLLLYSLLREEWETRKNERS